MALVLFGHLDNDHPINKTTCLGGMMKSMICAAILLCGFWTVPGFAGEAALDGSPAFWIESSQPCCGYKVGDHATFFVHMLTDFVGVDGAQEIVVRAAFLSAQLSVTRQSDKEFVFTTDQFTSADIGNNKSVNVTVLTRSQAKTDSLRDAIAKAEMRRGHLIALRDSNDDPMAQGRLQKEIDNLTALIQVYYADLESMLVQVGTKSFFFCVNPVVKSFVSYQIEAAPVFATLQSDHAQYTVGQKAVLTAHLNILPSDSDYALYLEARLGNQPARINQISDTEAATVTPALMQPGSVDWEVDVYLVDARLRKGLSETIAFYSEEICKLEKMIAAETDPEAAAQEQAQKDRDEAIISAAQTQLRDAGRWIETDHLSLTVVPAK